MRILLVVVALVFVLVGCGDDDEPIRSGGPDESTVPASPELSETLRVRPEVCDLATETDVEAAFGEDVPPGTFSSGGTTEDDVEWKSDICSWDVEDGLEVSLAFTTSEDFEDGELLCPELDSFDIPSTPVEGVDADSASWVNDKIDPNEGTLRICTPFALMDIDVESPDGSRDPDTMQSQAVALAEVVLTNLG